MDLPQYKILAADLSIHALLLIDGPSCRVLAQMPYPESFSPVTIALSGNKAFVPANDAIADKGALFVLNLSTGSLYRLPVSIPPIAQFTLHPGGSYAYLIGTDHTLYQLDMATLSLSSWGGPGVNTNPTGMAATETTVYTIWENAEGGSLVSFNLQGELLHEAAFSAIPTSIRTISAENLLITFTASQEAGEGVLVVTDTTESPVIITTLCPHDMLSHQNYPIHAAVSSDGFTAYLVNEDSASVSVIDLTAGGVTGHILVGRSISRLYILPDSRFALASSALFADLVLLDLVNAKVLATSTSQHELYPDIALLPS